MKSFLVFCLLFFVSCYGVFVPLAVAADRGKFGHASMDTILEFSLSRLKESMQRTMQKSERLAFENDMLRKSIQDLQQMRDVLVTKKAELSGMPALTYHQQKQMQFTGFIGIENRKQKTQRLMIVFERDIEQLKGRIQGFKNRLNEKRFGSQRRTLAEKRKEIQKSVSEAEKRLKSVKKRNRVPLKNIAILEEKQRELIQEMRFLEGKVNRFRRQY